MRTLVSTICCRKKLPDSGLLPARKRYLSPRIKIVDNLARKANLPFAILSGKYGLLEGDAPIPYYDKLMSSQEVGPISLNICRYLKNHKIKRVIFFINPPELDPHVVPYLESMQQGVHSAGAKLDPVFVPPYPERI